MLSMTVVMLTTLHRLWTVPPVPRGSTLLTSWNGSKLL